MTCCCSLAGTVACWTCPNWTIYCFPKSPDNYTFTTPVKRVIEKFDEKGNLIERITEE